LLAGFEVRAVLDGLVEHRTVQRPRPGRGLRRRRGGDRRKCGFRCGRGSDGG
jgi:hypothetical protein